MNNKLARNFLSAAIAAVLVAEAAPALAQVGLEEIVVTARKRDESILKVPVTATVLTANTLDQYAIRDVRGIADMTPGLNLNTGPASSGVLVSLRGVGTSTNNPTIDQSVALVTDGMQFTQGLAFGASMFDMAQVEVLKGPQALFFGKAAPAGVISIRTADPTDEAEVIFRGGYETEAKEELGEIILSGPVSDTLGLRLATQFSDSEGYFHNKAVPANHPGLSAVFGPKYASLGAAPVTEKRLGGHETLLVRGTAVWEPTEAFNARLKMNYGENETQGYGGEIQYSSCPEGTTSTFTNALLGSQAPFFKGVNFIGGDDCKLDRDIYAIYSDPSFFAGLVNGGVPFTDMDQNFGTLEWNYDMGNDLTLSSVTGLYDMDQASMTSGSATTGFGNPFMIQGTFEREDLTQEFRLTSDYDSEVNFMLGAFYQDGSTEYELQLPTNSTYNTVGLGPLPPYLAWPAYDIDSETKSLFGQVTWQFAPEWELGAGVRWTDEERSASAVDKLLPLLVPAYKGLESVPVTLAKPDLSGDNWSPELSLTYSPTDDMTIYGNLKRAYKSGSFDTAGAVANGDDISFDDEKVTGGEIGIKNRLMDGQLLLNAATYYYEFEDLQVEAAAFDPLAGKVGTQTINAASAEVYGVETDFTYAVPEVEGLTINGALNWNIAEYNEFDNAECYYGQTIAMGCNLLPDRNAISRYPSPPLPAPYTAQDLAGESLVRAPEWTANLGFNYETPVAEELTLRFGAHMKYSDSYSADLSNAPNAEVDSYVKSSATISLSGLDDKWMLELIGDNLSDEVVSGKCSVRSFADTVIFGKAFPLNGTGLSSQGLGGLGEAACNAEAGRAVWLRFTYRMF